MSVGAGKRSEGRKIKAEAGRKVARTEMAEGSN